MKNAKKGFTLIELLIVIGIIAVLAAAVLLVLNPAQILAETRDTQRLSDLDAVRGAVSLTLLKTTVPAFAAGPLCMIASKTGLSGVCVTNTVRTTGGLGWVGVDFGTDSPLAVLPADPTNSGEYGYSYAGSDANKTFELNARLESLKHRAKMQNDGGNSSTCTGSFIDATCWYEVGTDPGLDL